MKQQDQTKQNQSQQKTQTQQPNQSRQPGSQSGKQDDVGSSQQRHSQQSDK